MGGSPVTWLLHAPILLYTRLLQSWARARLRTMQHVSALLLLKQLVARFSDKRTQNS
jgi:hypothetical protein